MDTIKCLVCDSEFSDGCPRCGIPRHVYENVIDNPKDSSAIYSNQTLKNGIHIGLRGDILGDIQRAKLSHYLHKIDFDKSYTEEDYIKLRHIISEALDTFKSKDGTLNLRIDDNKIFDLPNPMQQLDRLILFLGNNNYIFDNILNMKESKMFRVSFAAQKTPQEFENSQENIQHINNQNKILGYIGINSIYLNKKYLNMLFKEAINRKWIEENLNEISLTLDGYQYYQSLLKNISHSSFGFLAMKFPPYKNLLDIKLLTTCLKSDEIKKATGGFSIYNPLETDPKAGNITFNMLNHIRDSRFMVAELSHHNNGAYWEAGYAFGLGKHVFFMCHKNKWKKTHFDIAQQYIILWTEETIQDDCKKLADMIKFHFPEGAIQNTYLQ